MTAPPGRLYHRRAVDRHARHPKAVRVHHRGLRRSRAWTGAARGRKHRPCRDPPRRHRPARLRSAWGLAGYACPAAGVRRGRRRHHAGRTGRRRDARHPAPYPGVRSAGQQGPRTVREHWWAQETLDRELRSQ